MGEAAAATSSTRAASVAGAWSHRPVRHAFALVLYLAVTCVVFAPLLAHPDSRVLQGLSDATQAIRTYDVMAETGKTPFTFRHDPLNGAPEGTTETPETAVAAPVQHAVIWGLRGAVGTVAALNLYILAGFVLTGYAGFALLDWARLGTLPSLFGGYVVAFNPWMVERAIAGHVGFVHGWGLILLLALLTKLRIRRTPWWAVAAGAAYGVCFLLASYTGLLATALVLAWAVVDVLSQRNWAERLWTCTLLVTLGAATLVGLLPGIASLASGGSSAAASLAHRQQALQSGGAVPTDYLLPLPRHPLWGSLGHHRGGDIFHERIYVGFVVLVLAALTTVRVVRHTLRLPEGVARPLVTLGVVVVPVAFLASMPRKLTELGVTLPMPSYAIGSVTTFFRAYLRLGYVVEIGLAVLAAAALWSLWQGSGRAKLLSIGFVALTVVEFLPGTLSTFDAGKPPAYDQWLATRQPPGIAAHYPMITDLRPAEQLAAGELYYQRFTQQPLYEIYGPQRLGTRADAIRLVSRYVDAPKSLGVLAAEGVRYVIIHDDVYRKQGQEPPNLSSGATLLRSFGPVHIYRVSAKPVDLQRFLAAHADEIAQLWNLARPAVTFANGFYSPETYQSYATKFHWMSDIGHVTIDNPEKEPVRIALVGLGFGNGGPRRLDLVDSDSATIASEEVSQSLTPIRLGPFDVPPGRSDYTLTTTPGAAPLGGDDPRLASVYLSELQATRVPDLDSK
jgi:hypothetical protein